MSVCLSATLRLFLILPLCGSGEVLQDAPQVLKGGSVLRAFPPAQMHDIIKRIRAIVWLWHSVAPLQVLDYLRVRHTCTTGKKCSRVTTKYFKMLSWYTRMSIW